MRDGLRIAPGQRGDAAHALHPVEHQPLGGEDGAGGAGHEKGFVAGAHHRTVVQAHVQLQARVHAFEQRAGQGHAGQDAGLLDQQPGPAFGRRRDRGQGAVVPVAHVFFERQLDQAPDLRVQVVETHADETTPPAGLSLPRSAAAG
jgi:hypothetical protein